MRDVQVTKHGAFQAATAPGADGGFVAWAKMGPITGDCPVSEPGEHVWFCFGASRDEALRAVLADVGLSNA